VPKARGWVPLRPQGGEHEKVMAGRLQSQPGDGRLQRRGGVAVQPGAVDRRIQVASDEIVRPGVSQVDRDAVDQ